MTSALLSTHHSMAAMMPLRAPDPSEFKTLAARISAPGATPRSRTPSTLPVPSPAAVAATWVPCHGRHRRLVTAQVADGHEVLDWGERGRFCRFGALAP